MALPAVQAPSPLAYPQVLWVGSHTPEAQTRAPAAGVQIPLSVGLVWLGSVGIATSFARGGVQE
jgi:hypothetical protein